ncbi:hypothetical protein [Devosia nitrariae]|uniref:Uncharacterized protein n=1 Tax=Devosia nitrariae TaxID=2071872 RepID=A0ABQ5W0N0_9HYPH|nr:hypothetical protein [Devosia nitrariae]GLQ53612.1 hypothetical protein GCM10010862_08710 [Devosia nitrariae]
MLPDLIPIPTDTAARYYVSGDLTARDQSWAVALLVQAVERGETGTVLLPDNRTREALGLVRRDKIVTEEARWRRLRAGIMCRRKPPTVTFATSGDGSEYPVRHNLDDMLAVTIDEDLARAFDPGRHGDLVYLPLRILQRAECRYTLTMMMRVLAWSAGEVNRRWVVRDDAGKLKLRVPMADLRDALSTPAAMKPVAFAEVLETVCREITELTDYSVTAVPRKAHTGRIRDIEIDVIVPDVDALVAEAEAMGPGRPKKRWRPKDRPSRRAPAEPVAVSKSALDAAVPLSVKRPDTQDFTRKTSNAIDPPDGKLDPSGIGFRNREIEF